MKRAILIGLVVVLVAVGGYCGWRYYNDVYVPNKQVTDADKTQRELFESIKPEDAASAPSSEDDPEGVTDSAVETLRSRNDDAVGWLTIDGTVIDYPIVQTTDNTFYLENGFDGTYNYGLGCPFLDFRCQSDFKGFNSIVYAHHILGYQAMFSDITNYKDPDFMKQYPNGTLRTKSGAHQVRFFAYMIIPNPSFAYQTEFTSQAQKDAYIDEIYQSAEYPPVLKADDLKSNTELHLLLLSTCTYEYWQARGVLAGVIE